MLQLRLSNRVRHAHPEKVNGILLLLHNHILNDMHPVEPFADVHLPLINFQKRRNDNKSVGSGEVPITIWVCLTLCSEGLKRQWPVALIIQMPKR